jgi:rod shape-determining protein MreB
MVLDIGGGTTDVGIVSLGGLVIARNIRIAGDRFNADIVSHIRNEYKILIGDKTAEEVKVLAAAVVRGRDPIVVSVRGRDLVTGLPREINLTDEDVRNAIGHSIDDLVEQVKDVIEATPPEILGDVMERGMYLAGGGALIGGLPEFLTAALGIPVIVAIDPLTAVVRGTAVILEDMDTFREVLKQNDEDLVPTE